MENFFFRFLCHYTQNDVKRPEKGFRKNIGKFKLPYLRNYWADRAEIGRNWALTEGVSLHSQQKVRFLENF